MLKPYFVAPVLVLGLLVQAAAAQPATRPSASVKVKGQPSPPDAGSDESAPKTRPQARVSTVRQVQEEQEREQDLEPTEETPYAERVVVTASRTEEEIIDAPVAISIVGPEVIETTPADNYADLLRGTPGLNVTQLSARDINFTSRVNTTTLSTSQLALVDGRSVYQDFFGFVMWDVLPFNFEEVQQVEILRGPGSAIWGPNAIGGVVNVRTKAPRDIDGGLFVVGGGEQDTFYSSILWADAPSELFSYKLSASWFEQDNWPRPTTTPDGTPIPPFDNEGSKQPKLDLRFDYEPEDGQRWIFRGGDARTSGIIHTGIGPFRVDDSTEAPYFETAYEGRKIDGKFYVNWIDGQATNLLNGLDFVFETATYVGDISMRQPVGDKNLLVFGGDIRYNDFDLSIAPREDKRQEFGVFLEDQIMFNEHVLWNIGARIDDFDTIGTVFSPRTSLVLKPNSDHAFRLAYNKAYRAPSLVNNYLETAIIQGVTIPIGGTPTTFYFPSAAVGNEDLNEETVDAFELAWTGNFNDRVTVSLALYHNVVKDNIDFHASKYYTPADPPPTIPGLPGLPNPPGPPLLAVVQLPKEFTYRNVGEVTYQGAELGFNVNFMKGVTGQFSYTWQDEPEVEDDNPLDPLELGVPAENLFYAGVNFDRGRYTGSFGVSYTDEAFWTDVLDARYWGATDAYTLVNASFGVEFGEGHYKFQLNATNLLDEDAQQHVFGDIIGRKITGEFRARW